MSALVAWQGELEFLSATWNDKDGSMAQFRLVRTPEDEDGPHPFRQFTKRRGHRAGTRFNMTFALTGSDAVRELEVMLADWVENAGGRTIKFWLSDDGGAHPFAGFTRPSTQQQGDRLMAGFVELGDDDEPVDQQRRDEVESAMTGGRKQKLSQLAALMCRQNQFWRFLSETVTTKEPIVWDEKYAAQYVRHYCKIKSRSDLDRDDEAANRFHQIRRRYVDYQEVR